MPALRKLPRADSSVPGEGLSLRDRDAIMTAIRTCPHPKRTLARRTFLRSLARSYNVTLGCIEKYQARVSRG